MSTWLHKRSRSLSPIGLDLGAGGIRAAQLKREGQGYRVIAWARHEFHEVGAIASLPTASQIQGCLKMARFKGNEVVVGLSAPDVEFHPLQIPPATLRAGAERAAQFVAEEIERLSSVTAAAPELETRFWLLPPSSGSAPAAMGVGAPRALITRIADACQEAGLYCAKVSVAPAALSAFASWLQTHSAAADAVGRPGSAQGRERDGSAQAIKNAAHGGEIHGVLDLGLRQARLVLCSETQPVLVRAVGTGGRFWTDRIATALDISPRTAEVHKRNCVLDNAGRRNDAGPSQNPRPASERGRRRSDVQAPGPGPQRTTQGAVAMIDPPLPPKTDDPTMVPDLIGSALRRELHDLAGEIKRSYEYVMRCYPGKKAGNLLLVGGGSLLGHLPEFLGDALGIPVCSASDCLRDSGCRIVHGDDRREPIALYAAAIGLVLRD